MTPVLRVFVAEHCPGCVEAREIARQIEQDYPAVIVRIVDIGASNEYIPDKVFATPTYMLDDRIVSLGNPGENDIIRWMTGVETVESKTSEAGGASRSG